jgi:RNA ligase
MTLITEILDYDELLRLAREGYIRIQIHPEFPELYIANYAEKTAFERAWNPITMMTRGLIWNDKTLEVLARPFPKFFNWDEKEAPRILDDQVVWHYDDKFDGSLGIMYHDPNGNLRIATRGSFASEQAKLGQKLIEALPWADIAFYHQMIELGYTPLVEICGPDNRIVLRYDENFLAPLGFMTVPTGEFFPAGKHKARTMRELLGDLSRENSEGWVVWLSNTKPLKIKQADYIELHRMVSNLTKKEVWRQLAAGTYHEYVKQLPDELYNLAQEWADELRRDFNGWYFKAYAQWKIVNSLTSVTLEPYSRKAQAQFMQKNIRPELHGLIFSMLDGRSVDAAIWRMIEPMGG